MDFTINLQVQSIFKMVFNDLGWIDTKEDNFPGGLSSALATLVMPFGEWLLHEKAGLGQTFDFFRQGKLTLTIHEVQFIRFK